MIVLEIADGEPQLDGDTFVHEIAVALQADVLSRRNRQGSVGIKDSGFFHGNDLVETDWQVIF